MPQVIITGMHRSGTSLTASLFQQAGINIGNHLIGADKGNSRGHFEDIDFNNFHIKVLKRFGQTFLVQNLAVLGELTPEETQEARSLIEERCVHELWGWKDPRSSLFLDFWRNLLPESCYIFVYRHPLEVTLSLLRRGKFDFEALVNPLVALRAWQVYNQAILNFYQQHPANCILAHISAVVNDAEGLIDFTVGKLELPLKEDRAGSLYQLNELRQMTFPAEAMSLTEQLLPGVLSLYAQLEEQADLSDPVAGPVLSQFDSRLSELQQLITRMTNLDMLGEEQRAYLFSLLLTHLAPEAVLAGKTTLDDFRTEQIHRLQTQLTSKEIQVGNLQQQLTGKETQIGNLQQQLANKDAEVSRLQQQLTNQVSNVKNLEHQLTNQKALADDLAHKINAIESTKAWQLTLKWYAIKEAIKNRNRSSSSLPLAGVAAASSRPVASSAPSKTRPTVFRNASHQDSTTKPAILFISHDAGRTGAPMLLLNFLKWFKANTSYYFEVLLKKDGELRAEFEALAPTMIWYQGASPDKRAAHMKRVKSHLSQSGIHLIFANTITNGDILAALSDIGCPVICYVHELEYWIEYKTEPGNIKQIKKFTTHYVTGSQAVKDNLVEHLEIPADKIDVVHSFIFAQDIPTPTQNRIRCQLQIPEEAFIVGACGTTDWRKGPDLFVQLARAVYQRQPTSPVHFIWVGGQESGPIFGALWHDVKRIGLENCVHFVSTRPNFREYFAEFDVFVLVSREDPFPLVNLEAALLGKPIICFDGAGGSKEFVEEDAGFVVSYLDIEAMADKTIELLNSPELQQQLGQGAARKVFEQYDVGIISPKMLNIIEQFLGITALG